MAKIYEMKPLLLIMLFFVQKLNYRTRTIAARDLYIYYPIFEVNFFVFKEFFFRKLCPYVWLVF